ncbi:MAG: hypothetical protein JSR17_12480 [Proteobacteria bacterium]|nr:hypothetical protein [Pseudomonadota bacterium]
MRLVLVLKVIVLSLAVYTGQAFSQNEELSIKLKALDVVKTQEKGGDELFISVSEFPAQGKPLHYQIPSYPTHWLSKYLVNVKDVVLWKKQSSTCMPAELLITLVEEDFEPWNMDDAIGSLELKIDCVNGKAVEKWTIPTQKSGANVTQQGNTFTFEGDGAKYKATFSIDSNKTN